jgi:serine O-acetyltransferase
MPFVKALKTLRDDIRSIFINDPAARNLAEVLLYQGLHAIFLHRIAHYLYQRGVPFFPRLISQYSRFLTGIEIHPGAQIGHGFCIDHGMGVVIGETTIVGNWVTLYQGVTLGGTGKQCGKRHPTIEDHVVVGVGASVLGDITVGHGARIGGGAVVVRDVPPHTTAIGIPARAVLWRDPATGETRRLERLPDPEGAMLRSLHDKVLELENRLVELEEFTDHHVLEEEEHHLTLSRSLWAVLDDIHTNGKQYDEEFTQGTGI